MADVILAVLGRREAAHGVLDAARCLATLTGGASIMVLAVEAPASPGPLAVESLMAEVGDIATVRRRDRRRMASLKTIFDLWAGDARQAGLAVQWNEVAGVAGSIIEARGRRADFVVIARPASDDDATTRQEFQAALFQTERPVLVVPMGKSAPLGRCVGVAWRDDSPTAKAIIPALRFLGAAQAVHLLAGVHAGAAPPAVPAVLQDHGIGATRHVLTIGQDSFGKLLLKTLHALGADILVMGAYAHLPLREMIFGGLTRYMLDHADLPVLMRH